MFIEITEHPVDPWQRVQAYQQAQSHLHGKFGATSVFVGTMRDINEAESVNAMELEHYPGMTEKHLQELLEQADQRWEILDALIVHRVGRLEPADPIVVVAVWSAHRAHSFEASRFLMEALKSTAPFWKREVLEQGTRWVQNNTSGYTKQ